jgi:hypothetical protein
MFSRIPNFFSRKNPSVVSEQTATKGTDIESIAANELIVKIIEIINCYVSEATDFETFELKN